MAWSCPLVTAQPNTSHPSRTLPRRVFSGLRCDRKLKSPLKHANKQQQNARLERKSHQLKGRSGWILAILTGSVPGFWIPAIDS